MQSAAVGKALWEEEGVASLLAPPTIAPPVFFCTVEPISAANQRSVWPVSLLFSLQPLQHALQFVCVCCRPGACSAVPGAGGPQPQSLCGPGYWPGAHRPSLHCLLGNQLCLYYTLL